MWEISVKCGRVEDQAKMHKLTSLQVKAVAYNLHFDIGTC